MVKLFSPNFSQFREKFVSNFVHSEANSWFPGHMYKGMLQMQAKLAKVDCILEVHDARIPFSGRNPKFYTMLTAARPHILILNKSDLIDPVYQRRIVQLLEKDKKENLYDVLFTDCKSSGYGGVNKIIPTVVDAIQNNESFNRMNGTSYNIMVIGVPNVGKSSIINRLRNIHLGKKKASSVGATPGITKSVLEKIRISDKPLIYLYDTPGVSQPQISNLEVGLRLALCRTLKESLVGEVLIADYLLYWLNLQKNFSYVKYLHLSEPTDDIRILLVHVARNLNLVQRIKNAEGVVAAAPDLLNSSRHFVKAFWNGEFGKLLLDIDILNKSS